MGSFEEIKMDMNHKDGSTKLPSIELLLNPDLNPDDYDTSSQL